MNVRQIVPKDAIPSVDDPSFGGDHDDPNEEVVSLAVEGDARAYPIRYLHYHEIVNDEVGGVPVAVTWCPLCGSAVVYDRRVGRRSADGRRRRVGRRSADGRRRRVGRRAADGQRQRVGRRTADGRRRRDGGDDTSGGNDTADALTFGVSGKLADDGLVMYDRETDSEWKQSSGVCIAGPHEGRELPVLPAAVTTCGRFAEEHPDGVVLAPPGGESEAAGEGDAPEPVEYDADPYEAYFEADGFGLGAHRGTEGRGWGREDVGPKAVVLGVEIDGDAVGFPRPVLEREGGVVAETVGGVPVVAFLAEGIHAFENPGYEFEPVDAESESEGGDPASRFRADGTTWNGATGESADGRSLTRLPARRLFAFAWQDDHGPDAFYGLDGE